MNTPDMNAAFARLMQQFFLDRLLQQRNASAQTAALCRDRHRRHSTAMHMLQAGVDVTLIALWLGHESPTTTHMYVEADLTMKERALNAVQSPRIKPRDSSRPIEYYSS